MSLKPRVLPPIDFPSFLENIDYPVLVDYVRHNTSFQLTYMEYKSIILFNNNSQPT
jgi:hypothetical protein